MDNDRLRVCDELICCRRLHTPHIRLSPGPTPDQPARSWCSLHCTHCVNLIQTSGQYQCRIPVEPVGLLDTKWAPSLLFFFSATFWFLLFTDALSDSVLQNSTLWTSMQRRRRVFTSRPYTHKRGLCCRPVSIRLSVTFVYCIQAAEDIVKLLSRPGSPS